MRKYVPRTVPKKKKKKKKNYWETVSENNCRQEGYGRERDALFIVKE